VEHVGDAVAGRYLLVAPSWPRAARRQYHAVDLLLDRTVVVRFDPRDTHDGRRGLALHTADGYRVIADGEFDGVAYVVVEIGRAVGMSLSELEALLAVPCAPEPAPAAGSGSDARGARGPRPPGTARLWRALASVLALAAVVAAATLFAGAPRPSRPATPAAAANGRPMWVSTAR
jgi:hypothetical protein